MKILGIETSCDETAAAVVENGTHILSNVVFSQIDLHKAFGGVVPEIAARSHLESINAIVGEAVEKAGGWKEVDAIAVTSKPGLIGALMIGTLAARSYALALKKPLISVHHIKGHIYANFLERTTKTKDLADLSQVQGRTEEHSKTYQSVRRASTGDSDAEIRQMCEILFPILALVVSGGHTQIILLNSHSDFAILGSTRDDAVGEVFDKVARILGLPYPGGPEISRLATSYSGEILPLPIAKLKPKWLRNPQNQMKYKESLRTVSEPYLAYGERGAKGLTQEFADFEDSSLDFSFSGLKTAVLRTAQKLANVDINFPSFELKTKLTHQQKAMLARSFEQTAVKTLIKNLKLANSRLNAKTIMIAGGVAANATLREALRGTFPHQKVIIADPAFCTDNAAMIASAGYFQTQSQETPYENPLDFSILPRSSLPLPLQPTSIHATIQLSGHAD